MAVHDTAIMRRQRPPTPRKHKESGYVETETTYIEHRAPRESLARVDLMSCERQGRRYWLE
jgi:hypothetical protein